MARALDGYPRVAPPLRPPVVFDQHWCSLAFLHWPVRPDAVAAMFPPGTRPDVFDDGHSYVGLVPFEMRDAGLGRRALPYFGRFLETNVRLYSVDDSGRHGVLFGSLETSRAAIVPLARTLFGIPYTWSRMRMHQDGSVIHYESVRRWPRRGLRSSITLRIGSATQPTALEEWLTARWGAHSRVLGRTIWVPNAHEAWPLHEAELLHIADELVPACGVSVAGELLRVLWSPGVHAQFARPSLVQSRSSG
ncbi:MAG TPA: DUF2071 domain-containing protein [Jatrophihabitantaceae bacterium]|jgi:hypothetical protein|nr:DUF2071 domain-containing protein [Jatrophihabitantaceae bacterium]